MADAVDRAKHGRRAPDETFQDVQVVLLTAVVVEKLETAGPGMATQMRHDAAMAADVEQAALRAI